MSRQIIVEHDGETYYGSVMTVRSTSLGTEDHGILTAFLHMEGDGTGVGVGGYSLDEPVRVDGRHSHRQPTAYGFDHVVRLMETVGVSRWEQLPGKQAIVLYSEKHPWGSSPVGIANTIDEKRVFIFKQHVDEWLSREPGLMAK